MHRIERLNIISDYISRNGKAEVAQLSEIVKVSEATIRRDLAFLAGQKKIVRSHGGAVLNVLRTRSQVRAGLFADRKNP